MGEWKPMLKYEIYCGSRLVARFTNESDRDVCLDWLADYYDVEMSTSPERDEKEAPDDGK